MLVLTLVIFLMVYMANIALICRGRGRGLKVSKKCLRNMIGLFHIHDQQ